MQTTSFMKVMFLREKKKDKDFIDILMEIPLKENGNMTKNIQVSTITRTVAFSKENSTKERCLMV